MSASETANLLLGLVAIVAVASTLFGWPACSGYTRRRGTDFTPPVTIFKPLKGMDEGLEENLRSFFRLDYPIYQLIFCVADADDPAIEVVRKLQGEFPERDSQLVVGCPAFGLNPKVESLAAMEPAPQARRDPDQRLERAGRGRPICGRRPATWPSRAWGW